MIATCWPAIPGSSVARAIPLYHYPGLTLSIGERDYFELVMQTAERELRNFMDGKPQGKITEIDMPDVPLWAVWAIQQYAREVGKEACFEKYGALLKDIIAYIEAGKHPNLQLHDNGLLYANGRDRAITWMNSTANGRPVVPRTGYIVEFNALWYNALKFVASLAETKATRRLQADWKNWLPRRRSRL